MTLESVRIRFDAASMAVFYRCINSHSSLELSHIMPSPLLSNRQDGHEGTQLDPITLGLRYGKQSNLRTITFHIALRFGPPFLVPLSLGVSLSIPSKKNSIVI